MFHEIFKLRSKVVLRVKKRSVTKVKVKVSILTAGGAITSSHHRVIYDSVSPFTWASDLYSARSSIRGRMKPNFSGALSRTG